MGWQQSSGWRSHGWGKAAAVASPVTIDAAGTNQVSTAGTIPFDYTGLTVTSANAIVALLAFRDDAQDVGSISVTWDPAGANQALTAVTGANIATGTAGRSVIFAITNPSLATGNKTLRVSWTETGVTQRVEVVAVSLAGANATFGTAFTGYSGTGTGATASVTVTSATNHKTLAQHTCSNAGQAITAVSGTQLYLENGINPAAGASYDNGAASVAMTATFGGSMTWASAGVDVSG